MCQLLLCDRTFLPMLLKESILSCVVQFINHGATYNISPPFYMLFLYSHLCYKFRNIEVTKMDFQRSWEQFRVIISVMINRSTLVFA